MSKQQIFIKHLKIFSLVVATILFFSSKVLLAEEIHLNSGEVVEGKIIEKNEKFIRLDVDGTEITYWVDEIENIQKNVVTDDENPRLFRDWAQDNEMYVTKIMEIITEIEEATDKQDKLKKIKNAISILKEVVPSQDLRFYHSKFIESFQYMENVLIFELEGKYQLAEENRQKVKENAKYLEVLGKSILGQHGAKEYVESNDLTKEVLQKAVTGDFSKTDRMLTSLNKALELDPKNLHALIALGGIYSQKLNKHDEAVKYFLKALEIDSDNEFAIIGLALAYHSWGKNHEAIERFEELLRISSNEKYIGMAKEAIEKLKNN